MKMPGAMPVLASATENNQQPKHRVLVVTYAFPPVAYVGVHRTLKFCKYLRDHQWEPVVLTARASAAAHQDPKLARQIPADTKVYRTPDIDPIRWLARFESRPPPHVPDKAAAPSPLADTAAPQPERPTLWKRFRRIAHAVLTNTPDSHVFWVPFGVIVGAWILLRHRVDVIYCSSPPHSSHMIAFVLGKCFRKPYVIDFRDPWYVSGSVRVAATKHPALLKLETRSKAAIVGNAAAIVSVSDGERQELLAEYPRLDQRRVVSITNGYDPQDFEAVDAVVRPRTGKLTVIHAGTLYAGIAGEFLAALRHLVATQPAAPACIEVRLVGEIAAEYSQAIAELADSGIVKAPGLQPHGTTLQMIRESDVLLILLGGSKFRPSHIPAKVFEYLHTGNVILAIARDGELTQIVTRSGLGTVVHPDNTLDIARVLWDMAEAVASAPLPTNPDLEYIRAFQRSVLTRQLVAVLNSALPMVRSAH